MEGRIVFDENAFDKNAFDVNAWYFGIIVTTVIIAKMTFTLAKRMMSLIN
jgi:hypothetical protein